MALSPATDATTPDAPTRRGAWWALFLLAVYFAYQAAVSLLGL